jgi:hypothetical protein
MNYRSGLQDYTSNGSAPFVFTLASLSLALLPRLGISATGMAEAVSRRPPKLEVAFQLRDGVRADGATAHLLLTLAHLAHLELTPAHQRAAVKAASSGCGRGELDANFRFFVSSGGTKKGGT